MRADAGTSGNNGSDSDDEEEVISVNYVNKDPMTKQPIKNPVKNKVIFKKIYTNDYFFSFVDTSTTEMLLKVSLMLKLRRKWLVKVNFL